MQTKHILTSDFFKTKKQTHSHKTKHILTLQHLIPLRQIHKTTEWELKVYGTLSDIFVALASHWEPDIQPLQNLNMWVIVGKTWQGGSAMGLETGDERLDQSQIPVQTKAKP